MTSKKDPTTVAIVLVLLCAWFIGCGNRSDDVKPQQRAEKREKNMPVADLKRLEDELYKHGLASFRRIRAARPKDTFYSYAYFTSGEFGYVATTASTYEGLDEVVRKYKEKTAYKNKSLDYLIVDLKWSPCDSPLHESVGEILKELDPLLPSVAAELNRQYDFDTRDGGKRYNEFMAQIQGAFLNALKRIDAEGAFGDKEQRKAVVVNLLMGDQSDEERIRFARVVNPRDAVEQMIQDLAAAKKQRRLDQD